MSVDLFPVRCSPAAYVLLPLLHSYVLGLDNSPTAASNYRSSSPEPTLKWQGIQDACDNFSLHLLTTQA